MKSATESRWSLQTAKTVRTYLALSLLLLVSREVCAECPSAAFPAARPNSPGHLLEAMPSLAARTGCARETHSLGYAPAQAIGRVNVNAVEGNRWSLEGSRSAEQIASQHTVDSELNTPVQQSLSGVRWTDSRDWIHNPPEWVLAAKNYKRQGMPILHLMQSEDKSTLLSLGVSNHGKPGLYLTRKLPF